MRCLVESHELFPVGLLLCVMGKLVNAVINGLARRNVEYAYVAVHRARLGKMVILVDRCGSRVDTDLCCGMLCAGGE